MRAWCGWHEATQGSMTRGSPQPSPLYHERGGRIEQHQLRTHIHDESTQHNVQILSASRGNNVMDDYLPSSFQRTPNREYEWKPVRGGTDPTREISREAMWRLRVPTDAHAVYIPSGLDFPVTPPDKRDIELVITLCALWFPAHRYESHCVKTDLNAVS